MLTDELTTWQLTAIPGLDPNVWFDAQLEAGTDPDTLSSAILTLLTSDRDDELTVGERIRLLRCLVSRASVPHAVELLRRLTPGRKRPDGDLLERLVARPDVSDGQRCELLADETRAGPMMAALPHLSDAALLTLLQTGPHRHTKFVRAVTEQRKDPQVLWAACLSLLSRGEAVTVPAGVGDPDEVLAVLRAGLARLDGHGTVDFADRALGTLLSDPDRATRPTASVFATELAEAVRPHYRNATRPATGNLIPLGLRLLGVPRDGLDGIGKVGQLDDDAFHRYVFAELRWTLDDYADTLDALGLDLPGLLDLDDVGVGSERAVHGWLCRATAGFSPTQRATLAGLARDWDGTARELVEAASALS